MIFRNCVHCGEKIRVDDVYDEFCKYRQAFKKFDSCNYKNEVIYQMDGRIILK